MEGRCATCRWWPGPVVDLVEDERVPGECQRITDVETDEAEFAYVLGNVRLDDGRIGFETEHEGIPGVAEASFWTYAEFGCVLWESKP